MWKSPLDCKEIQTVHSEGDQSWVVFGRNDAKAETPVLWPPHAKSWLIEKDFDAGRDWGQEEKGTTEDEMAGWHHWLDGHEFEWTPGDGDGQGCLACCNSWGRKESGTTEQLNWTELNKVLFYFLSRLFSSIQSCSLVDTTDWFLNITCNLVTISKQNNSIRYRLVKGRNHENRLAQNSVGKTDSWDPIWQLTKMAGQRKFRISEGQTL